MKYEVTVRVNGRVTYTVDAESPEEAVTKANELTSEEDFGALEDIDWETKEPEKI